MLPIKISSKNIENWKSYEFLKKNAFFLIFFFDDFFRFLEN